MLQYCTHATQVIFPSVYVVFNVIYWVTYMFWLPDEIASYPNLIGRLH